MLERQWVREVGYLPPTLASHWSKAALKSSSSLARTVVMLEVRVASVALENSLKETDAGPSTWELAHTH